MNTLRASFKNAEIRRAILFTIAILLIFRIGNAIPVPFINTEAMKAYFDLYQNTAFGLLNTLSGGAFANATIFALSVQPYINASIIIQLLCIAIPILEKLSKQDGEAGKKKIENITKITAVAIGLLQAYGYYVLISRNGLLREDAVGVWWKAVIIILAFALGSVAIMFMGKAIDKRGIGNGISMILFAGIVSRLPNSIFATVANVSVGILPWWIALLTYLGVIALVVLIVYVNYAERRIPVYYASKTVGRRSYAAKDTYIGMRVNMSGVMPIIFAQSLGALPATIAMLTGHTDSWWAQTDTVLYAIIYAVLIILFAYFYATIIFNPVEVANNLKNNGGMIPGFRPGRPTGELLESILNKITLFGAVYLGIIAVVPMLIEHFVPTVRLTGLSLGGTTVIIAVGVALDTIRDLQTKLQSRSYSGLFVKKTP